MSLIVRASIADSSGDGRFVVEGAVDDCKNECTNDGCAGCGPLREEVVVERRFAMDGI